MPTIVTNTPISPQRRFQSHLNVNAHVDSDPMIMTNTPTADLALTNLTYCLHANLHGFAILGTKLYLTSIADSFVLFWVCGDSIFGFCFELGIGD